MPPRRRRKGVYNTKKSDKVDKSPRDEADSISEQVKNCIEKLDRSDSPPPSGQTSRDPPLQEKALSTRKAKLSTDKM